MAAVDDLAGVLVVAAPEAEGLVAHQRDARGRAGHDGTALHGRALAHRHTAARRHVIGHRHVAGHGGVAGRRHAVASHTEGVRTILPASAEATQSASLPKTTVVPSRPGA